MAGSTSVVRRALVAAVLLLVATVIAPGAALAGILADVAVGSSVQTARWSAIPVARSGTALTTSFQTTYGSGGNRYAIVDIYNSGTVPIAGFTIGATRSGGSGNGTVQSCAAGWAVPSPTSSAPRCSGSTSGTGVGSLTSGGSLSVPVALQPGGRLSLRIQSSNTTWSLSVSVTA